MTSGGVLEHARAVAFAITGVGTAYFGPFLGFKAAAQIALGASGTPGAQVAQTMLLARSLGRGGCPGQIYGEISPPGRQFKFEPLVGHKKRHPEACVILADHFLCPTRGSLAARYNELITGSWVYIMIGCRPWLGMDRTPLTHRQRIQYIVYEY